ncbi:MAG TPA: hypothetical protein PK586_14490 [Casimicrobium sp.]|nr:hypothetical protein [Casimicrobium sp.]
MTAPTAKELLAQADRLMRRREPGAPEELPVLTDLVVEEIEMPSLEFSFDAPPPVAPLPKVASAPAPSPAKVSPPAPEIDYVTLDEMIAPVALPAPAAPLEPALTAVMPAPVPSPAPAPALALAPVATLADSATPPAAPQAAVPNVREQFNAQIVAKLEEVRHAVFNQAMQQLELHADGGLKHHLRESLTERLVPVVDDIVQSVIEETTQQVREVVARAVDAEIARLREQLSRKR